MKRYEFNALIIRDDAVGMHAVGRSLVHLLNRQTEDEKATAQTRHNNQRGFTSGDARRGTITAKYYVKHRRLETWQMAYWLKAQRNGTSRVGKYYTQIAEEAKKKALRAALA
jgi:hypothetical protein